jgi:hypothetical protein
MIHQDTTHELAHHAEELGSVLPVRLAPSYEAQVSLVHQGGGLQRVPPELLA